MVAFVSVEKTSEREVICLKPPLPVDGSENSDRAVRHLIGMASNIENTQRYILGLYVFFWGRCRGAFWLWPLRLTSAARKLADAETSLSWVTFFCLSKRK